MTPNRPMEISIKLLRAARNCSRDSEGGRARPLKVIKGTEIREVGGGGRSGRGGGGGGKGSFKGGVLWERTEILYY